MTAIVCQFLWSGIAPSGDDKSQQSGPQYMLKVSCDPLELWVIYSTTYMFMLLGYLTIIVKYPKSMNKRHFFP